MRQRPSYLVGFAESVATPEVCFSLREAKGRIVCFYRRSGGPSFARLGFVEYRAVTAPEIDLIGCVRDLEALLDDLQPEWAAPCDDAALLVLSRLRNAGSRPFIPTRAACEFAMDKYAQMEAAAASGFHVMRTVCATSEADISAFAGRPAILKPRYALDDCLTRLDKGAMFVVENDHLPERARKALLERPYLLQDYKTGVGEGLFGIAHDGELHAIFGHRRLRMMNPEGSGASACVSRVPDADETEAAKAFVRKANWQGPFMIELLRDSRGQQFFMEFNGRFWGSLALARRCGLDIPRLALDLVHGGSIHIPPQTEPGFARHLGRDFIHLLLVLRGRTGRSPADRWPRFSALRQVIAPNRLHSFYNYDPAQPFFFLKDAAVTVSNAIFGRRA